VRGETVLEIGGGIGAIELELLAAGAERATSVELSSGYEEAARELLAERGLADRVERRLGDFAADPTGIGPHDVVVMHRVVCCYPDADTLVGAAAERARRRLVLTYPQDRALVHLAARAGNLLLRLSGSSFRIYVHRLERIDAAAAAHGLTRTVRRPQGMLWETALFAT